MESATRFVIFGTCICLAVFPATSIPATFCDQTFTVFGKTAEEPSIIMWELHTGGECESWHINVMFLHRGEPISLSGSHAGSNDEWVGDFLRTQQIEEMITIPGSNDTIYIDDSIYFLPPGPDTAFTRIWNEEVIHEGSDLPALHHSCRKQDVTFTDEPVFYGIAAERIYHFGGGLYKDYSFKEAVYFPQSNYLIIMTNQPLVMPGMNRLDGMLIYKLTETTTE